MPGANGSRLQAWVPIVACALPLACAAQGTRPPGAAASAPAKPASAVAGANGANGSSGGTHGSGANGGAGADPASMDRARRAAESPLRAIIEAGRVRRRIEGDSTTETEAAPPAPARFLVAPDTPVITIRTLPSEPEVAPAAPRAALAPGGVAPLTAAPPAVPELTRPVPGVKALPPAASAPTTPELRHMVEPEAPPRLLEQLTRPEVAVEFTIAADGSVVDVEVQPPVPRALVPRIVEALGQWRYAPAAAPRRHRVQLVFRSGG